MRLYCLDFYFRRKISISIISCFTVFLLLGNIRSVQAQAPTITSFSPVTVCQGNAVTITGTNFTGATAVKLGANNAASFSVNSSTTITAVAGIPSRGTITITTPGGSVSSSDTLTVLPSPIPSLTDVSNPGQPFTNCDGNATYQLTVSNGSAPAGGSCTYEINWGDGPPFFTQTDWPVGAQTSHTYTRQGYFNIVFSITPANGCKKTIFQKFYNGANPLASFTTTHPTTGLCVPAPVEFQIGNWFDNSIGTTYQIVFGDGSRDTILQHPLNSSNAIELTSHTYNTSSCPKTDFTATLNAINGCFTTTYTLNQIIIRKKPVADFTSLPSPACINSPVCFTNTTTDGYSGTNCNQFTSYKWDFGDNSTSTQPTPPCHSYALAGTYSVVLTASNLTCGDDIITKQVVVKPTSLLPVVAATSVNYCRGQVSVPLVATGTGLLWYTTATGGTGSPVAPTPPTIIVGTRIYYVSQTEIDKCESERVAITVVVNEVPSAPLVSTPVLLCQNQTASPLTATGTGLLWYTVATGGTGSPTAPTPSTANTGSTSYYVSQTANGCEGPRASIVVTVNPLATAPIVISPITYCQNQQAAPLTATGTNLLWYPSPIGGTGTAAAPVPTTSTVGSTTYYVSQTTPCGEGPRTSITVNVTPGPSATIAYDKTALCNVVSSATTPNPPINVTITGATGGTFSISPGTGLPINATTGTINPSGATIGNYTITYKIAGTGGCLDFTTTATVSVSATPNATITYTAMCTSDAATNVQHSGTQGGAFSSTAGLIIDPATGTITPGTSTPGTYVVTYTIAPSSPCPGFTTTTSITITQAPSATIAYNPTNICNVTNTGSTPNLPITVTFTGTAGGSYSIAPSGGLPIDQVTGTISPSGATAGNYTITYTVPGSGGCPEFKTTTTVSVNATPIATVAYAAMCASDAATNVQLGGTQGGTFSSTTGLVIDPATGVITPGASTPGTYVVTYTITPSSPCPGFTTTTSITITQAPSASIAYNPTNICNVANTASTPNLPITVTFAGTAGGSYSIAPSGGLPIDPVTGTITPSGATAGNYTITYMVQGTGGCPEFKTTTTVSVSASPIAMIAYVAMCTSDAATNVQLGGTQGGTFSSTAGLIIDPATGTITPGASTPGTYVVTYTIAPSSPCPGFTTTTSITITQAPSASIAYNPTNICNVANTGSIPNPPITVTFTGTAGGSYSIAPSGGLPIDQATGTITPPGATAGNYTITYTVPGTGGCPEFKTTATVSVSGAPTAVIIYPLFACTSEEAVNVQLSGTQGGTFSSTAGLIIDAATGIITPGTSTPGTYVVTYTIAPSSPCPGFTTSAGITITKAPLATITYNPASLCNVLNSAATPNPPVGVTFTGSVGGSYSIAPASGLSITTLGTLDPSGAIPGTYTITYFIAAAGGCADYQTSTTVNVSGAPTAAIIYPGSPYCQATNTPQPVIFSGTLGGVFSSGAGLSINAVTGEINPSLSTPGIYTITYTIVASSPCPGFIATTSVEIAESPIITFPVSSKSICSGETAVYTPSSTVANTTYVWSVTGALPVGVTGVSSGTASGPNPQISLSFTNTGEISQSLDVQVTPINPSQNPCAGKPYILKLIVNPIPPALAADTFHFCMGTPATPLTVDPLPGNTIKWYDENLILLNSAPTVSTSSPARFIFYVSQSNDAGCESAKTPIPVIVHPTAKIISSSYTNPTVCGLPSGSIILNVLDLNGNGIPNMPVLVHYTKFQTSYQVLDSTDASGKITIPLRAGTYSEIYVETEGCVSQKIPDVFVLKDPDPPAQPIAGYNPPVCTETALRLTAVSATSSQAGPIDYVWAGPAFGSSADTTRNTFISFPSASLADAGTYIVYAIQNNCISTATSFQVVIKQSPSKPQILTKTPLCTGDDLTLQAFSSIPGGNATLNYLWTGPGRGFPVNSPNAAINNININDAGIYTITVNSLETGCSSSSDTLIQVGAYPIVKFANDSLTLPTGFLLNLDPVITNAAQPNVLPMKTYEWTPSQNLTCNDALCSLPVATIKNSICYSVKVTNIYGCSGRDEICIKVICQGSQVFIPNAFTPRGNLPENAKFMVRASGINAVKSFRVFNRWGRIVFERNNFPPNDPNFGWDGKVNGKLADAGVYVYIAEVICENGVPYHYQGNVTLL